MRALREMLASVSCLLTSMRSAAMRLEDRPLEVQRELVLEHIEKLKSEIQTKEDTLRRTQQAIADEEKSRFMARRRTRNVR